MKVHTCKYDACAYRTTVKDSVEAHYLSCHGDRSKPVACALCGFRTSIPLYLRRHVVAHHTDNAKCQYCSFRANRPKAMFNHITRAHPAPVPPPTTRFEATGPAALDGHMKTHLPAAAQPYFHDNDVIYLQAPGCSEAPVPYDMDIA